MPNQQVSDGLPKLRRRVLLTASRPRNGNGADGARTVRFVSHTFWPTSGTKSATGDGDGESREKDGSDTKVPEKAALAESASDDQEQKADPSDDEDLEPRIPTAGLTPCSDYPDDAVLIETEVNEIGEPVNPLDPWLAYIDWD